MANPEINLNSGVIVDAAKAAIAIKGEIADLETNLKTHTVTVAAEAVAARNKELDAGRFVGLVRVTGEEMPACRVEMRTNGSSALSIEQEDDLNELFGPSRPLVFHKTKVVTEILDPAKLIADLVAAGKNPWDHLKLSVKGEQDEVIASCSDACVVQEAFMPPKGR